MRLAKWTEHADICTEVDGQAAGAADAAYADVDAFADTYGEVNDDTNASIHSEREEE